MSMVEVTIDSIRISLISQYRIVVLKEVDTERYLAIWIGAETAEAIHMRLQEVPVPRPLTHDLLKNMITAMGGVVSHVVVNSLHNGTFHAQIVIDVDGERLEVDSRSSDALALAVRAETKIFVDEQVMADAYISPEEELSLETGIALSSREEALPDPDENLEAFRDFVDTLDLDDLTQGN